MSDFVPSDLARLERKLDQLTDAVSKLILLEERQITQASRLSVVEARLDGGDERQRSTEKKVDQWINRGIGMWAVLACLAAVAATLLKFVK